MYDYERWAFNLIYLTLGILILGISLGEIGIENPLTDLINQNFLNPIFNESAGDAGYNTVNTMVYALVLSMFVVALSAWLRFLGIDGSDMTIIALSPFVFWAATGEVVEDARMLNDVLAPYFVSPGIHFQTAFWVILAGFFSYRIAHSTSIDEDDKIERVNSAASLLVLTQFLLYSWSIQEGSIGREIGLLPLAFFGLMAVFLPQILGNSLDNFTLVQRGVYIVGLGGTMVFPSGAFVVICR
jgi:Predicted membrane protein